LAFWPRSDMKQAIFKGVFTNLGHTTDNENLECKACLAIWQTKVCTPIFEELSRA